MLQADLKSHHIEGYASAALDRGIPAQFSVPLVSHIHGNLWVGGCIHGVKLPPEFRHVISLYRWERYDLDDSTKRREWTMLDSNKLPRIEQLMEIAAEASAAVESGQTLIHCQAGLNRSNLIAALVLRKQGLTSLEAIELLRDKRSSVCLCNETFETWLLSLDDSTPEVA